jgi:hypothetical protein
MSKRKEEDSFMNDQLEGIGLPTDVVEQPQSRNPDLPTPEPALAPQVTQPGTFEDPVPATNGSLTEGPNGLVDLGRHARAGRKGARRIHQLIEEGRLYEQEHGLKRGRQRLRQLIELGKLYEQEHGLRPARASKGRERLSRMDRDELLATLLQCLMRLAKPSFRGELARLADTLTQEPNGHDA